MYAIEKEKVQSGEMTQWMKYSLAVQLQRLLSALQDTWKTRYISNPGASMERGEIYSEFLENHR